MADPLRVLRLTSVFEPPVGSSGRSNARFDPVGGMQLNTGMLTRELDRLGVEQTVVTTRPPGAPMFQRIGTAGVIRLGLPIPKPRQLYALPAAALVPALAARHDVVHVHLGEDLAALPIAAVGALLWGKPLVVSVHCSLRHTLEIVDLRSVALATIGAAIEELGSRLAAGVIVLTDRLARLLCTAGVAADRIHVLPPAVEIGATPGRDPFPLLPRPRVVFVGRLVRAKGVHTLLRAAERLRHPATIVFVGDGPERAELEREAAARSLNGRLRFTGFVPHSLIPAVLAHADLVVMPSMYEELGRVLLEALGAGVPVVASRTGGIPEVVEHERTGLLVRPGDDVELAAAIDRVIGDPATGRAMSAASLERAARFRPDAYADRVLGIYDEVLMARRGRGLVGAAT